MADAYTRALGGTVSGLLGMYEDWKRQPQMAALGGLLMGDTAPAKEWLGVGQPWPKDAAQHVKQGSYNLAMDWNNPIAGGLLGVIKDPDLVKAARNHFGITQSPRETGYLIENPVTGWTERLDLSGRHYGAGYERDYSGGSIPKFKPSKGQPDYLRNDRAVDHRELDGLVDASGSDGMNKFMDQSGAVRYFPGVGASLLSSNKPSKKQIETLVNDFRYSNDPLFIDIDRLDNGENLSSMEFNRPTIDEVMNWIEKQYGLFGQ